MRSIIKSVSAFDVDSISEVKNICARLMIAFRIKFWWWLGCVVIATRRASGVTCWVGLGELSRTSSSRARLWIWVRNIDRIWRPWWSRERNMTCAGCVTVCLVSWIYLNCRALLNWRYLSYGIWLHRELYPQTNMMRVRRSVWIETILNWMRLVSLVVCR